MTGMNMHWDHLINAYDGHRLLSGGDARESRHFVFVREFASVTSLFQDKAAAVIEIGHSIANLVEHLKTCPFTTDAFTDLLAQIQKTVRLSSASQTRPDSRWTT